MTIESKRFPGVDLAKVIAIFFVVVIHVLGGLDMNWSVNNSHSDIRAVHGLIRNISYSCIDLFALATGFLCVSSRCKYSRLANLWIMTVFWGMGMLFLCTLGLGCHVPRISYCHASLPVLFDQYWFFTAYFMLFLFMPFLNQGIMNLSHSAYVRLLCVIGIFICGYSSVRGDLFKMNDGFSFVWLSVVYLIGAYFRRYNPCKQNPCILFSLAGLLAFVSFFRRFLVGFVGYEIPFVTVSYVSPITLGIAIMIFSGCLNLKLSDRFGLLLKSVSITTFGIYLIHQQPYFWHKVCFVNLHKITVCSVGQLIFVVFGISVVAFIVLSCLEYLRIKLFTLIGIDQLVLKIDNVFER